MSHPLIGLVGQKQVGKDTLAASLCLHHDYTRVAFADLLKDVALASDPLIVTDRGHTRSLRRYVECVGWDYAKQTHYVRRYLQTLGSAIRAVDPHFWVTHAVPAIMSADGPVVVTDVRYQNEADLIRSLGGVLVRVSRPGFDNTDPHASEQEQRDIAAQIHIRNNGTLDDLEAAADVLADVAEEMTEEHYK